MKKAVYVVAIAVTAGVGASVYFFGSTQLGKSSREQTPTPSVFESPTGTVEQSPMQSITPTASQEAIKPKTYSGPPAMSVDVNKTYQADVKTSKGTMKLTLFAKDAPKAVNNFVFLAREGFYNDTVFHRIIKGFMIQGGDPKGDGTGGPGYKFDDEPVTRQYTRGTIAMANSGPNTNGSQFFIMHADYALPKNYVIFGAIDEGDAESLKTLDAIAQTQVTTSASGEESKPIEKVVIQSVTIQEQ